MEKIFSMEWKIFSMEWKIFCRLWNIEKTSSIPFHSMPCSHIKAAELQHPLTFFILLIFFFFLLPFEVLSPNFFYFLFQCFDLT